MNSTMIRRAWVGVLIVMFAATAALAQRSKKPAGTGAVEQEVRSAMDRLHQAATQGEKDVVGGLVTDDVTWVGINGQVMNKDQVVGMLPAPAHTVDVQQVLTGDKTAIVVGVAHFVDGDFRFVQEWTNRGGQWKLDAHEATRVVAPEAGGMGAMAGMNMGATPSTGTTGTTGTMTSSPAPTLNSAAQRAVWRVQEKLGDAFLRGDERTYSKYTAPEYVRVTPESVIGKTEFLRTVRENAGKSPGQLENDDVQITVEGNTARVLMVNKGTLPGGQQVPPVRVTRIFEKRSGQWQQVTVIFTPIAGQ